MMSDIGTIYTMNDIKQTIIWAKKMFNKALVLEPEQSPIWTSVRRFLVLLDFVVVSPTIIVKLVSAHPLAWLMIYISLTFIVFGQIFPVGCFISLQNSFI